VLRQGAAAFANVNAMTGVGAVTGALLIAKWGDHGQRGQWLVWAILGFPVVLIAFAVNRSFPLAILLAVLLGAGFMLSYTLINTLMQTHLADEMRGRVMSLYTLTFFGFTPFGNLAIGWMAEVIGLSEALILSAVLSFVTVGAILVRVPSIRKLP
jgi:MFS family permease